MSKMFIRVQASDWYNLEHHTTRRKDSAAAESNFCRFLENDTPTPQKCTSKRAFLSLTVLCFLSVENFLRIFWSHNAYKECFLGSKETFGITQSITRHSEMILRQLRAVFVDFQKMELRKSKNPLLSAQKSFFSNLTGLHFLSEENYLWIF